MAFLLLLLLVLLLVLVLVLVLIVDFSNPPCFLLLVKGLRAHDDGAVPAARHGDGVPALSEELVGAVREVRRRPGQELPVEVPVHPDVVQLLLRGRGAPGAPCACSKQEKEEDDDDDEEEKEEEEEEKEKEEEEDRCNSEDFRRKVGRLLSINQAHAAQ